MDLFSAPARKWESDEIGEGEDRYGKHVCARMMKPDGLGESKFAIFFLVFVCSFFSQRGLLGILNLGV